MPIKAEEAETMTDDTTAAMSTTPPLLPLGRKAWAILDGMLPDLLRAAKDAQANLSATRAIAATTPQAATKRVASSEQRTAGAVAVVPLCGIITPRGSLLSMLFGGGRGGLAGFREDFAEAVASPDIGAIVIDVDSPGGLVDLVPETAAMIRAARGNGKPIIAVVNTLAASAAYWLASQADEIVATPSGELGSVGVYMLHVDYSGMNEKMGVDPTYVKVPRYKAEGNSDEPLSEDAQAAWQQDVEDLYAMFVADVAAGRNVSTDTVKTTYGEGRCLPTQRALEAGMCDRIGTLEQVVAELLGSPATANATSAEARIGRAAAALEAAADRIAQASAADEEDEEEEDEDEEDVAPDNEQDDDEDEDDETGPPVADEQDDAASPSAGGLLDRQIFAL